jgi:hypothetical protein
LRRIACSHVENSELHEQITKCIIKIFYIGCLTFHPRCCLPGPAASGSGVGKKPLRSLRAGDQGERGPRLPARYGSVPINDVRSNAAGSLSSLIFDKHGFQVYLQFNNTTAAYLQCCRLPMLQPSKWLPTAAFQVAPNDNAAAYTAGCQHVAIPHCKWLPTAMLQSLALMQPLCYSDATSQQYCSACRLPTMLQPLTLYCRLACRLAEYCLLNTAMNCPPINCQPTEPARRLLTASRLAAC